MPLAAHEASSDVLEDASTEKMDGTPALEVSEASATTAYVTHEEMDGEQDANTKITTCAELLAIEYNNRCCDCNTEV